LTVTDVNGNVNTATATVTVIDNLSPIVTVPASQVFCANANGSTQYTIPVATATDNCSIATVTYAVTGATSRTGTGYDASGAFNIGTSTITWTVKDVNGNTSTASTSVVVNPLPVATYVISNADAFCNQTSLTASSSINPALYSWSASNAPASFTASPVLSLGLTNADGNYYLYTQSSVTGCVSATAAVYNFQKQSLSSSYTILAYKEVELGKYNKVLSGSVGVMSAKGEAEFKSYSGVTGAGSFVKAPKIDKDGYGITLNSQVIGIASVTLPTMQYNTVSTHNLPSYTASQNNATLSGNYKNLTIKKGISVTVSGNTFGNIRLEEGASIRFTSTVLNIENFTADKGRKNNDYTYIRFAPNSSVRVGNKVSIGSQVLLNPESYKVSFYMGDQRKDEEKFTVKGGDTRVIANILMPNGKLRVTATDSDHDDDHHGDCDHKSHSSKDCKHRGHEHNDCDHRGHTASSCQDDVYMTGLFVAEKVESKGNKVIWNSYDCSAPAAPITSVNNNKGVTQSISAEKAEVVVKSEEELKVTVMPNPSTTYFTLKLESKYETPVNLRVMDGAGRVVDARSKLGSNSTFQIGHSYSSGTYYAELIQGTKRKVVQLIKARG
ncbi:MAG: T9SS type A sorting domain-containing protein, partial [Sulfuricurvum sp.]|nr:T9SS type A sorting domain-containing protein [Sulfuricurvum sp.]